MEEKKIKNTSKENIDTFLKTKDKLLTAFGIFLALTIFTKDLEINSPLGNYLSFIFMSLTILVWLELWSSFPSKNRSWTLVIFENLINIGTFLLVAFWGTEYYEKGKLFIFIWVAAAIASILTKILEKLGWTNSLKEKKIWRFKIIRYLLGFLFIAFYLIITLGLAALVMGGLNPLVESFKN